MYKILIFIFQIFSPIVILGKQEQLNESYYNSALLSDAAHVPDPVAYGNVKRVKGTGREKCEYWKLDEDIKAYHAEDDTSSRSMLPRIEELRKKYPGESFDKIPESDCADKAHPKLCKHFAENGGCVGQYSEAEALVLAKRGLNRDPLRVSFSQIQFMATECRETCKKLYENHTLEQLPKEVQIIGGFDDVISDYFGHPIHICETSEGFTNEATYRAIGVDIVNFEQAKYVPALTARGFEKTKIPKLMYAQILTARKRSLAREKYKVEYCDYGMQSCQMVVHSNISKECHLVSTEHYQMLKIDPSVISSVFEELKPLAEKWIDNRIELVGTAVYGLRKYTRGAWLHAHLDHLRTHVVSAILNIAQDVDEDWPLQIEDHQGNKYEIILAPGDMVWYESAKLIHARIKPFKGRSYENIFVHYMPRSLNWYTEDVGLTSEPSRIITISDLENAEIEFKEQRKKARDELEEREKLIEEKYSALSVEERLAVLSKF